MATALRGGGGEGSTTVAPRLSWPRAVVPVALYLVVRALSVIVLAWMSSENGDASSLGDTLSKWDGLWYLGFADGGYEGLPPELTDANGLRDATTPYGFLPGYSIVMAAVGLIPGLSLLGAGLLVSAVAGAIAAVGVARLTDLVSGSRRAGLIAVALFAGSPMAVSLSMVYTEALFCALAVWALIAVLRERWAAAGLLTMAAGLVRSTSVALIAAVAVAGLVGTVQRSRSRGVLAGATGQSGDGSTDWEPTIPPRPFLAVLLAPLGFVAWLAWVAVETGSVNGWFELRKRGWGDGFSALEGKGQHLIDVLSGRNVELMDIVSVVSLVVVLVLVVIAGRSVPWPLSVYAWVVTAVVAISVGFNTGNARLLLPATVVLAIPPAAGLSKRSTGTQIAAVVAWVAFGAWFGGYALVVYPFAV